MTKRRDLQQTFAQTYLDSSGRWLRRPPILTQRLAAIRTIVVDTPHLTSGHQQFTSTWTLPGTSCAPKDTAYRATRHSSDICMRGLHQAVVDDEITIAEPATTVSDDIEMAAWHHGDMFDIYAAGSVSSILRYCDLTDNECEQIMMAARRFMSNGSVVFAVARGVLPHLELKSSSLAFDGLIACEMSSYSGTQHAITRLRKRNISVVYMTHYAEDLATAIAHSAGITEHPSIAHHAHVDGTPAHLIYAHTTQHHARRIIAKLPQKAVIAHHTIIDIDRMIHAF